MYRLLQVRVYLHHLVVQVIMIVHKDIGIPCNCHENGIDTGTERCSEEVAYLQTDEKGESDNDHGEVAVRVVWRVGELEP